MKNTCLFLFLLIGLTAHSQNYFMNGTPITDCSGVFFDSGGIVDGYSNGEDFTTTICPDNTGATHISLLFNEIDLVVGDMLCFFDGVDDSAPSLGCILDYSLSGPFSVRATAANITGCLTVNFRSNATNTGEGWNASISCVSACQEVIAVLDNTTPAADPPENGWIDVCPNQMINFSGSGDYPQSGTIYNQSDATSTFHWNFGDGQSATGQNVSHSYSKSGGYIVELTINDTQGCQSTNFIRQRVRVAAPPQIELVGDYPSQICIQDTFGLNSNINDNNSNIKITPKTASFQLENSFSEPLFIPDGINEYKTTIGIVEFEPGQILTDVNDIISICADIEHSYLADLRIILTCPSGNSVILQNFDGATHKILLGEPIHTNDYCDNTNVDPGTAYEYCWLRGAVNGTMSAEAFFLPEGSTLPAGNYNTSENLNKLLGCPLNGEWKITVTDNIPCDNGWLFSWDIIFDEALYPPQETFETAINDWYWEHNQHLIHNTQDSMASSPAWAGDAQYIFKITDEYGCAYDTAFNVNILNETHPDCFNCEADLTPLQNDTICHGQSLLFNTAYTGYVGGNTAFGANPAHKIGNDNHPPSNPYYSAVDVNHVYPLTISDVNTDIASICINMQTNNTSDIDFELQAPNGQNLVLINNMNVSGSNFFNTCFTPTASSTISSAMPPYTGDFQPIGDWSNLNGSNINGTWILKVIDRAGTNNFGTLTDWAITFKTANEINYTWSNPLSLSCNNCPSTIASPSTTTNYQVDAQDQYGCTASASNDILVVNILPEPNLDITDMDDGTVYMQWDAISEAASYEVNINNNGWMPTTGSLTHEASVFNQWDPVDIQLRAVSDPINCTHQIAQISEVFDSCFLNVSPGFMQDISCFGGSDGLVSINVQGNAQPPLMYTLNGGTPQNINTFTGLPAGDYEMIVTDNRGCMDTVMTSLNQPSAINATTFATIVSCNGGNDGTLSAAANGGIAPYSYWWNTTPATFDSLATGLSAGTYTINITDDNGCDAAFDQAVMQPASLELTIDKIDASCNGGSDASATAVVDGGIPSYTYQWDDPNNQTTATASNLMAGMYEVTVTDDKACTIIKNVEITEPDPAMAMVTTTDINCNNGNDGTATVTNMGNAQFTYQWDDPNNQMTATASNLGLGTYTVTTIDADGCRAIGSGTINQPAILEVTTSSTPTLCEGSSDGTATITPIGGVIPYNYLWNDPNNQTNATATNLPKGTYTVTVTDANNCENIQMISVEEADPIVLNTSNTFTTCATNSDGTASVMASGGTNIFTYAWDDPNMQTTATAINLANGLYTVTVTDGNSCSKQTTVTITSDNVLQIDDIIATNPLCNGENSGAAEVFLSGGTATYSFLWDDPNGEFSNPAINLYAGDYTVTVTDANNCSAIGMVTLVDPPLLSLAVDSTMVACFGDATASATAIPSGGTTTYTYAWDDPNMQTSATATNLTAGTYTVTATDTNNCSITEDIIITEPTSALSATVQQTFVGCYGEQQNEAEVIASGGTGSNYAYLWSNNQTINTASNLDSIIYTITVSDENNCTAIASIDIQELDSIMIMLANTPPTCHAMPDGMVGVSFVMGGIGMDDMDYDYQWNTNPAQNTQLATDLLGDVMYTVTVTDNQGCSNTNQIFLAQPNPILLTLDSEKVSCFGGGDGMAMITEVQGDNNNYTYQWDANTNSASTQSVSNLTAGTYLVTVSDDANCTAIDSVVVDQFSLVEITIDSTNNLCHGVAQGNAIAETTGGLSPYSYFWSNGGGSNNIEELEAGIYYLTVQDANACMIFDSVTITQPNAILVNANVDSLNCTNDRNASIELNANGGITPYTYSIDGVNFSNNNRFIGLEAGDYDIYIRDAQSCIWDTLIPIASPPSFNVDLGEDITIESGDSIRLNLLYENNTGHPDIVWEGSYEGTLSCSDCLDPMAQPITTIIYEVFAIDELGCEAEDKLQVIVLKNIEILVPTGFTPNDDGRNDILLVHGKSKNIKDIESFQIYDRWGNVVYEDYNFIINDQTRGWDGTYKGQEMNAGTYVWLMEVNFIDGTSEIFKGQTTLIR